MGDLLYLLVSLGREEGAEVGLVVGLRDDKDEEGVESKQNKRERHHLGARCWRIEQHQERQARGKSENRAGKSEPVEEERGREAAEARAEQIGPVDPGDTVTIEVVTGGEDAPKDVEWNDEDDDKEKGFA